MQFNMIFIEQPEWFYSLDRFEDLERISIIARKKGIPLISNVEEIYKFELLLENLSKECRDVLNPYTNIFFSDRTILTDSLKNLKERAKILFCGAHLIEKEQETYVGCVPRAVGLINKILKELKIDINYFIDGSFIIPSILDNKIYSVRDIKPTTYPQFSISLEEIDIMVY